MGYLTELFFNSATFSSHSDVGDVTTGSGSGLNTAIIGRGRANSSALMDEPVPPFQPNDSLDDDDDRDATADTLSCTQR